MLKFAKKVYIKMSLQNIFGSPSWPLPACDHERIPELGNRIPRVSYGCDLNFSIPISPQFPLQIFLPKPSPHQSPYIPLRTETRQRDQYISLHQFLSYFPKFRRKAAVNQEIPPKETKLHNLAEKSYSKTQKKNRFSTNISRLRRPGRE